MSPLDLHKKDVFFMKKWKNDKILVQGTDFWQTIKFAVKHGVMQPLVLCANHRVYLSEFEYDIEKCQSFSDLLQRKIVGSTYKQKPNFLILFSEDGKRAKTWRWFYLDDVYRKF